MFTSPKCLLGVFLAFVGSAGLVSADPGKGMRWGDVMRGTTAQSRPSRQAMSYSSYGNGTTTTSGVVAGQGTAVAGQTIAIRGSDGLVRVYPIQGGVVQQLPTQSTVTTRNPDGTLGTVPTPAARGTAVPPAVVIPCPQRR